MFCSLRKSGCVHTNDRTNEFSLLFFSLMMVCRCLPFFGINYYKFGSLFHYLAQERARAPNRTREECICNTEKFNAKAFCLINHLCLYQFSVRVHRAQAYIVVHVSLVTILAIFHYVAISCYKISCALYFHSGRCLLSHSRCLSRRCLHWCVHGCSTHIMRCVLAKGI